MFFTASRQDGMVHGWETQEMQRDATSHSRFSINTQKTINSISTLQGSKYFCLAGKDNVDNAGVVQVYEMKRLGRESSMKIRGSIQKNPAEPDQKDRNSTHSAEALLIRHEGEGEMMNCMDTILPVSYQHLLAYSS